MRVVSTVDEGIAICDHLKKFDLVNVTGYFGRLTFEVDVTKLSVEDTNKLIDELNDVADIISCYVTPECTVEFDYYITSDLLPVIRGIVEPYCTAFAKGVLLYWVFDDIIRQ